MTLLEIIFVLIIVSLIVAFAIPNIPRMRDSAERRQCVNNLLMIKLSKEQWALENDASPGSEVQWDDIVPDYLETQPSCPASGTSGSYTLNITGTNPACDLDGHVIE